MWWKRPFLCRLRRRPARRVLRGMVMGLPPQTDVVANRKNPTLKTQICHHEKRPLRVVANLTQIQR